MARIDKNLKPNEKVIQRMRPHWALLVKPVLVIIALTALFIFSHKGLVSSLPHRSKVVDQILLGVYLVFLFAWAFVPFLRWKTTKYLLTNERIIMHTGIIKTQEQMILLNRINDTKCNRSILERLYGAGSIEIEAAAKDSIIIKHIKNAEDIQNQIYTYIPSRGQSRAD